MFVNTSQDFCQVYAQILNELFLYYFCIFIEFDSICEREIVAPKYNRQYLQGFVRFLQRVKVNGLYACVSLNDPKFYEILFILRMVLRAFFIKRRKCSRYSCDSMLFKSLNAA